MGCDVEKPDVKCNCTNESCPRRENCCECVVRHRERNELPACFFPPEAEKTYDRSREYFIEIFS